MLDFYKYWYAENIYSISSKGVFVAVRNGCVGKKSGVRREMGRRTGGERERVGKGKAEGVGRGKERESGGGV